MFAGQAAGASVEPGLQDEDSGDLVDDAFPAYSRVAGVVEMTMGLGGGKALVPQVDGEVELFADLFGEGLGLGGLRALIAGHIEGVSDDSLGDGVLAQDAGYGLHVGTAIGAVKGEEGLRGEAEGIGEGDTDAAVAYVETDDALRESGCCWLGGWGVLIHKASVTK